MRRLKSISMIVFILGVSPFAWTQIHVSLQDMTADSGQIIVMPVTVSDLSGLNILSYQFQLTFDEGVLEALAATSEGTLTSAWGPPLSNTTQNGNISVGGYSGYFLSGSGTLVNLHFQVIGNWGQTTQLGFDFFVFNNGQPAVQTEGATFTINLEPIKVTVTTNVGPQTRILVDGISRSAPFDTTWYPGTVHSLGITSSQAGGPGIRYNFLSWSDGGAQTHDIAPVTDSTFIATLSTEYYLDIISSRGNPRGTGWYESGTTATFSVDSVVSRVVGSRYAFSSWTGTGMEAYNGPKASSSIIMRGPVTETANWNTQFYLTMRTDPPELTTISGSGWYTEDSIAITGTAPLSVVTEDTIFRFIQWSVDDQPVEGNPVSITMDTSHVATAHYNTTVSVVVTTSIGTGTQVIVDGNLENAPYTAVWSAGSSHTIDVPSLQSGGEGIRYLFSGWSDGQEKRHTIAPLTNTVYMANLTTQYYFKVMVEPTDLVYITGNGWYDKGALVQTGLAPIAIESEGISFSFIEWKVDNQSVPGNPVIVMMKQPHKAIAYYQKLLSISGNVMTLQHGLSQVRMILYGIKEDTIYTDDLGNFVFDKLVGGNYFLIPEKPGFRFEPLYRLYTPLQSDSVNQNFTAVDTLKPQVTLIAPKGREVLRADSLYTIRWSATDNLGLDSLALYYSLAPELGWQWIVSFKEDTSSYLWHVPEGNFTECKLRLMVYDVAGNMAMDESDDYFTISSLSGVTEPCPGLPTVFSVSQNYPNPFPSGSGAIPGENLTTRIQYQLPQSSRVVIQIFNLSGQEVNRLYDNFQEAGYHTIDWDGRDFGGRTMPSGVYFYRIQAGEFLQTRRMVLLR